MSILDFEGGSSSNTWNYSDDTKDNYRLMIQGDVVEVAEVQSINFATKKPETWQDGNPKLNVCLTIMEADGTETNWIFGPGGKGDKASNPMKACRYALQQAGLPGMSMAELGGLNITASTQAPPQGFKYGQGNPRPFGVQVNGKGNSQFRGVKTFKSQHQQQQAQPVQQHQPQPMQQSHPQAYIPAEQRMNEAMNRANQASMQMQQPSYDQPPYDDYGYYGANQNF